MFANTVCEYTGCEDKYGVKIFVNDKISDEYGQTYTVIFDDESCSFIAEFFDTDTGYGFEYLRRIDGVVIGNDFDKD